MIVHPMKRILITHTLLLLGLVLTARADLASSLEVFATYELGQPKKIVHQARLAVMKGTNGEEVRAQHERQLLEFVQSGANLAARREACLWLGTIGSKRSLPVLAELENDESLASVAAIAARNIREEKPPAAKAGTHALASLRAAVAASDKPAAMLIGAIEGEDDSVARLAFGLVASGGIADDEVAAWLAGSILKLPAGRQLLALHTLPEMDQMLVGKLAREGDGEVRVAAVARLRGGGDDLALLTALLGGADAELAAAAHGAFVRMDEKVARRVLAEGLGATDADAAGLQAKMIEIAVARGTESAAAGLWRLAGRDGHPNQGAAIRALGSVAPAGEFEKILGAFLASSGKPAQRDYQATAFEMARRQVDYDAAIQTLEGARASASPQASEALAAIAAKLAKLKPPKTLKQVRSPAPVSSAGGGADVLLPGSYSEITPKRFKVAAYLDCGSRDKVAENGITIECLNGKAWNSNPGTDPSISMHFAGSSLDYAVSGLRTGTDYILGLTWWDTGLQGRRQSVAINGAEVLPDTRALAYRGKPTPARIQFALLPEQIDAGRVEIDIGKLAGPNAVNSELWIMERKQARAEKRVLLVSGQDYPGHDWRRTGPVMEKILTADERMEVTVCETPYAVGLKHLNHYDAVFVHFKNYAAELPSTPATRDGLERFVLAGGGMCLSHFACGAFQEWPEFVNLAGRIWNGQGHDRRGPFTVRIVDKDHPITAGLEDFETDDELYFCLKGKPSIHLLCDAHSKVKKADQPQAFVFHPGKGRVFLCTLGHDVKAYDAQAVQQLYRQAAAWAAGLK